VKNNNNIFKLRFYENEVTPESFSAKELGELVISVYNGLKELIDTKYPTIDSKDVRISLVKIENQSESLSFGYSDQAEVLDAVEEFGLSIKEETYTDLPFKTYKAVKTIFDVSKKKKCKAELVSNNKTLFVVTPDNRLVEQEKVLVKSELVLYGELNKIGGDKTQAWVHLYDGSKIKFEINNDQLYKLREKTKEPIGIKGTAKWNTITKKVVSFKLKEVLEYTSGGVSQGFSDIKHISKGWDEINTNQGIINFLKGDA